MGLQVLHRARPDDGLLDLCVVPCRSHIPLLWHLWKTLLHEHENSPTVIYRQARHIRVLSDDRVPLEIDGDFAGWLPAEFCIAIEKAWPHLEHLKLLINLFKLLLNFFNGIKEVTGVIFVKKIKN